MTALFCLHLLAIYIYKNGVIFIKETFKKAKASLCKNVIKLES